MGIIKRLSSSEVQKIAAGQVVERPANVVKELVENSLDAGATSISVHVEAGGQQLIRVVDNGRGMDADDAIACFDNHATSKITSVDDLTTITTFGFRGEALASIAAVSRVELRTKMSDAISGMFITCWEASIISQTACTMTTGTDIRVRDLFFNVPARKKFLKKEETEWRAIVQLFQASALAHPDVHLQLFSGNTLLYNCPATTSMKNRAVQVLDDRAAHYLLDLVSIDDAEATIAGIISTPQASRYNKNQIFFLVNRRWIKNYQLTNALLKGYLKSLPPDRYPVGVITIAIDPTLIDVNVDPRKEEIRFAHPRRVEQLITTAVTKTLEGTVAKPAVIKTTEISEFFVPPQKNNFQFSHSVPKNPVSQSVPLAQEISTQQELPHEIFSEVPVHKFLGIFNNTYLLVSQQEELMIFDQHAAHERILFEQFASRFGNPEMIQLLFPIVISLSPQQKNFLAIIQPLLKSNGIDIDDIGPQEIMIRSTPVYLRQICFREFITYVLHQAQEYDHLENAEVQALLNRKLQAQMACKAAVKAGDVLTHEQAEQLVRDLYKTPNCFSCPHGRPTTWTISLAELEKKFKR
jgi:DNA mismatch repair protein MutL